MTDIQYQPRTPPSGTPPTVRNNGFTNVFRNLNHFFAANDNDEFKDPSLSNFLFGLDRLYSGRKPLKKTTAKVVGQFVHCLNYELYLETPGDMRNEEELTESATVDDVDLVPDATLWDVLGYCGLKESRSFYDGQKSGNSPERRYDRVYADRKPEKIIANRKIINHFLRPWGIKLALPLEEE